MTLIERQVHAARNQIWLNDWLKKAGLLTVVAGGAFAILVFLDRSLLWRLPLGWSAAGAEGLALAAGAVWSLVCRDDLATAAATLDQAAGLRERLSSSLYCAGSDDPFDRAVEQDAERISRGLQVRRHIRLRAPRSAVYSIAAWILAAGCLLLPEGLLSPSQAKLQTGQRRDDVQRTQAVVQKRFNDIKQLAQNNTALRDLKEELDALDKPFQAKVQEPDDIRNEAVKKIDKLADALREQRQSERLEQVAEVKKMLRGLKPPEETKSPAQKLQNALAQGDTQTAQESLKELQKQLATLKPPEDTERMKEIQQQLEQMSKTLESLAQDKQLAQKLEQSGIDKETIERALKNLTKKDLDQIRQQLEKSGLSQEQIEKLASQMQKRQSASQMCQKMAESMKQSASSAAAGESEQAASDLQGAGDQLSELEQLEQQLGEMDSTLASLEGMKNELDKPCPNCQGMGCAQCQGDKMGPGQGKKMGQGAGGLARDEQTATAFKMERTKVHTGKGKIVGQFLVDGEQFKGQASQELKTVIEAAERDATDAINRDRIPRQYQKAVKLYFSNLKVDLATEEEETGDQETEAEKGSDSADEKTAGPTESD